MALDSAGDLCISRESTTSKVGAVAPMDKAATPETLVRVQLLVAKGRAGKIQKARDHIVTVVERQGDGTVVRKMIPVALRLELSNSDKK